MKEFRRSKPRIARGALTLGRVFVLLRTIVMPVLDIPAIKYPYDRISVKLHSAVRCGGDQVPG